MISYATKVKRDIARWVEAGLIDTATAGTLSADIDSNGGRGVSLGAVLTMMAAALFAAAMLIFIAANWEAIPRLARVGLLFSAILAGYVGGAALKLRGQEGFGEAAWICAAAAFGASIALIGQMYHMSGDERQAIFIWGAGAALAAGALRSPQLTVGATLLGAAWMLMHVDLYGRTGLTSAYLPVAAALYALSFWTRSAASRHLVLLSLYLFVCLLYGRDESFVAPVLLAALSAGLLALGHFRPAEARRYLGLDGGLPVQALLGFLTGIAIMQAALVDEPQFLLPSIAAFAGIVAVLVVSGRENALLRWVAYAAFVFQLCFIYVVMLGTMLGTAGFFVVGGLAFSGLAWLISRLERRFAAGGAS